MKSLPLSQTRSLIQVGILIVLSLSFGLTRQVSAADSQTPSVAPAPDTAAPPPSAPAKRSAAELEKLVMPIALHPDPLIAIILPAAAYPLEIVQAARFVRDTNNIPKINEQPWDENVKEVAEFPEMIQKMDSDLAWTVELGKAFVEEPKELMDAIQALRAKAQKAGTLQTTPQQIVTVTNYIVLQTNFTQVIRVTNEIVQVIPANPQVIYVPTYPPTVYYPPPAYVYNPLAPLVTFGVGMAVGAIIANNCDWHGGGVYVGHHGVAVWGGGGYHGNANVNVNINNNYNQNINNNFNRNTTVNNPRPGGGQPSTLPANGQKWQPDPNRMRTSGAGGTSATTREARGWGSGTTPSTGNNATRPATGNVGAGTRPSTGAVGTRPSTGAVGARPSTGAIGTQPSVGNTAARPSTGNVNARPSTGTPNRPTPTATTTQARPSNVGTRPSSSGSAFNGAGSGNTTRSYSNRGNSSRSSGGFSGGSRGGGGRGGGRR